MCAPVLPLAVTRALESPHSTRPPGPEVAPHGVSSLNVSLSRKNRINQRKYLRYLVGDHGSGAVGWPHGLRARRGVGVGAGHRVVKVWLQRYFRLDFFGLILT